MQHLLGFPSPANRLPPEEQAKGRVFARMQKAFSIPMDSDVNSKGQVAFSLFYAAVVTLPFVVSIASWSFLNPLGSSIGPPNWPRAVVLFLVINFNVVNSVISLFEVTVLSSVRKQEVSIFPVMDNTANLFSRSLDHFRSWSSAYFSLFGCSLAVLLRAIT